MSKDVKRMLVHVPSGIGALVVLQIFAAPRWLVWDLLWRIAFIEVFIFDIMRHLVHWWFRRTGECAWIDRWERSAVEHGWLREEERRGVTATSAYALGLAAIYGVFPDQACLPAALILAFGDPAARWFGNRWPIRRVTFWNGGKKSVGGWLGFVLVAYAAVTASNLLNVWYPFYTLTPWFICAQLAGVVVAAGVELWAERFDNFWIPVAAAATIGILI